MAEERFHRKNRDFMNNLESKGYTRKLAVQEDERRNRRTWFLPHYGEFHPQKDKIRVVFDEAASHDEVSLNSQLHQSHDLRNSLLSVFY